MLCQASNVGGVFELTFGEEEWGPAVESGSLGTLQLHSPTPFFLSNPRRNASAKQEGTANTHRGDSGEAMGGGWSGNECCCQWKPVSSRSIQVQTRLHYSREPLPLTQTSNSLNSANCTMSRRSARLAKAVPDQVQPALSDSSRSKRARKDGDCPGPTTKEEEEKSHYQHLLLSGELLGQVFRRLAWEDRVRAERVCRRWRTTLLEKGWADVREFDTGREEMTDAAMKRASAVVARCGLTLQQMSIRWLSRSNPRATCILIRQCAGSEQRTQDACASPIRGGQVGSSLRHLRFENVECTSTVVKCVRESVGPQLWSLAVCVHPKKVGCGYWLSCEVGRGVKR